MAVALPRSRRSGQMLPVPVVAELINVDLSGPPPHFASKEQLLRGVEASMDEGDTGEERLAIIKQSIAHTKERWDFLGSQEAALSPMPYTLPSTPSISSIFTVLLCSLLLLMPLFAGRSC